MRRAVACVASIALAACGRLNFGELTAAGDAPGSGDAVGDGRGPGPDDPTLIAWYPLDGDPALGALDASGHGRTMSCGVNGCPTAITGRIGGAYAFATSPYLHSPSDSTLMSLTSFTVAAWLYVNTPSAAGYSVVSKTVGSTVENSWDLGTYSLNLPSFCSSSDGNSNACDVVNSAGPLNAWYHLAGTWDGTTKRIYVDGVETAFGPRSIIFDTHDVTIGCDDENGPADWCLDGAIDDVRIYSRALSPVEIAQLANP
jgi:hypothetical protein